MNRLRFAAFAIALATLMVCIVITDGRGHFINTDACAGEESQAGA